MPKKCGFSECYAVIAPIHQYCGDHFEWVQTGEVDACPICMKGKFVRDVACSKCSQESGELPGNESNKLLTMQLLSAIATFLTCLGSETSNWSGEKQRSFRSLSNTMEEVRRKLRSS